MRPLNEQAQHTIQSLATRYGVSPEAVRTLLEAVVNGHGRMAQFQHPELGGAGQWMQGGMTLVGDMFNDSLRSKVQGLCAELSSLVSQNPFLAPESSTPQGAGGPRQQEAGHWWPSELGVPSASGGQNHVRYAYFPHARRLVVDLDGKVTVYDTLDHQIGGVAQQQGGRDSITFTTQRGAVQLRDLPVVSPGHVG